MAQVRPALLSPPVTGGIAVLLLSLVVWFVGPLLPFGEPRLLDNPLARAIIIAVLVILWLVFVAIWAWRRRRRNAKLIKELAEPEADASGVAIDAEAQRLRAKFAEALTDLRKLRFKSRFGGSRYLYELPWYVFIGPPGAGKTTALLNCGLEFPLRRGDQIAVQGAAGTRDCDWMFTDEAVFIDTAGRYVTQDSDATVDRSAWTTFLDLLTRKRPSEPLNGVIVAISLADIATADAATLDRHALAIRRGLIEISERMRARIPVYVMFTKADLLAGFDEFFQGMSREEREQVWGATFPLETGADPRTRAAADLACVPEEIDHLLARLGEAQFRRLQDEPDLATRARIFGFPSQFSSLKPVIARFLNETFAPDRYSEPIQLRGFYLTSATQEGQPIDRLIASMSQEFGLSPRAVGVLAPRSGRAYFLQGLLQNVVFPESGLVGRGKRGRGAARAGKWAAIAGCLALPAALGAGWWTVNAGMTAETDRFIATLAAYEADIAALDAGTVGDSALERTLPPLDRLRAERDRLETVEPPLGGLAIADLDALRAQAHVAYMKGLDDLYRPRLLYRLERLMDRYDDAPAPLYDALKTYLMIGRRGEMDPDFVRGIIRRDWADRYDATVQGDLLAAFSTHLDAMLEGMEDGYIRERSLNEAQIAKARARARDVSPAARAFGIFMAQDEVRRLSPWSATDPRAGGVGAEQVLIRASGADLAEPIPGVYTFEGFWQVFVPNADAAIASALGEYWVLGQTGAEGRPSLDATTAARREIREIYFERYVAAWRTLLDDLRIMPFRDAAHSADVLRTLAAGGSPLRDLLLDVARQTSLSGRREDAAALLADPLALGSTPSGIARLAATAALGTLGGSTREGEPVTRAFADLHSFVGTAAGGSSLESVLLHLGDLRTVASDMAERRVGDLAEIAQSPAALSLSREADGAPESVRRMIQEMLETFNAAVAGGLRAQLSEIWESTVAPVCRQRLSGRYPFGTGAEAPLGDLAEILGPDGLIDRYFKARLASMVDTNQAEWQWKGLGLSLGIPVEQLRFFQRAEQIRTAFFPTGGSRPEVTMGVFSRAMHPDILSARIDIGGQQAEFKQGERGATRLTWPGIAPENGAETTLMIDTGAKDIAGTPMPPTAVSVGELGVWGLFRLIDKSEFRELGSGDRVQVGVSAGGRRIVLELRMESVTNPFALRSEIKAFQCPARL